VVKVLALREKFAHMSNFSGYDVLYHHLPDNIKTDSIFCNFQKMYPRGTGRLLSTTSKLISVSGFYNAQSVEAEFKLLIKSIKNKYDIIHYAYGEPYYGFGNILKKITKTPIVVTIHQPVTWWKAHEGLLKNYTSANTVITLSEYDRDYINANIPAKAICIPHGIDTGFYKPLQLYKNKQNENFKVIFAGRYLRDMVTLAAVIKKLSTSSITFHFDIVYFDKTHVLEPYLIEIMAMPNIKWHVNISEYELLSLYQNADCCLIPLEDSTANNALLEAMACGLPIVSTNLPSIKTYLDDSMSILGRKNNADDLCDALIFLYHDKGKKSIMGINARNKALNNFDWVIIANKTAEVFKSLC
jgi:glycosyltransferase involved in cell wall biosynthesis